MSVPSTEALPAPVAQAPADAIIFPPGDLYSDEPPLESDLHREQIDLLIRLLKWHWQDRSDVYVSGNLTVYYNPKQLKSRDFRGPDFFVVLGAEAKPRKSWVVWQEGGQYPNVIVELLSDSTAAVDRREKKQIYQNIFRTPEYFWFDPHSLEFEGFQLLNGRYQPIPADNRGWRWSEQLGLYLGIQQRQLRFFTAEGALIPTLEESTEAERQRAETAEQRAEAERQRAKTAEQRAEAEQQRNERLMAKLRDLGIDPETI